MREKSVSTEAFNDPSYSFQSEESAPIDHCLLSANLGGLAGLFMEGVLHPIDTIRTRIKANTKATVTLVNQVKIMHKTEGHSSFLRGFSCTLAGGYISNASYFYTYEKLKLLSYRYNTFSQETAPFVAAFIGGFLSNVLYLPFDVVRTRMQLKPGLYDYRHFFDGAQKMLKYEGFNKLYLGGSAFLALNALETSLTFGFYEIFYRSLKTLSSNSQDINLHLSVISSVAAASVAGVMINPLDVLVTRMQSTNTKVHGTISNMEMINKIYVNEGIAGFFKGVTGTVSYYAMGALILFPTYELLKSVFNVDLSK